MQLSKSWTWAPENKQLVNSTCKHWELVILFAVPFCQTSRQKALKFRTVHECIWASLPIAVSHFQNAEKSETQLAVQFRSMHWDAIEGCLAIHSPSIAIKIHFIMSSTRFRLFTCMCEMRWWQSRYNLVKPARKLQCSWCWTMES